MADMTIRDVPDGVHSALKLLARRNRRSLEQRVLRLFDNALQLDRDSPVVEAAAFRARLAGRDLGDTVAEIREERADENICHRHLGPGVRDGLLS